ncbi:peptidoglycan recognition protein 3-like [Macrosteles quadrilineatus]|uniref:peptidoglycan recognition protein 3-like n=1 Tax=Macrosteles quadrilineatus TaxID=74068 RepID=UPI0023E10037|nr:peptidoglycan recognition protein 3-like [Macrosteles quadrilineatus]
MKETSEDNPDPEDKSTDDTDSILKVITRRKWGAQASRTPKKQRLKHPVNFVRFLDTTTDADSYEDCSEYMKEVQKFRMFTGDTDIPYNFVVGSDSLVYEGVGWKVEVDRPLKLRYLLGDCLDIAFIGDLEDGFMPSSEMFKAAIDVIKYGIEKNYISPTYLQLPLDGWRPSYFLKPHR